MFYLALANQLHFLIIMCFSLIVLVISTCYYKYDKTLWITGTAFFTPFCLSIASFVSLNEIRAGAFIAMSEVSVVFILSLLLFIKINKKSQQLILFILYILPGILIAMVYNISAITNNIVSIQIYTSFLAAGTLFYMFMLRKEKGRKSILFWAMLFILLGGLLKLIGSSNIIVYISLIAYFAGFFAFLLYFYKESFGTLAGKLVDAEKKVSAVNKTLDLEVKKRMFEMERSHEKLVSISKTDPLTKSLNKVAIFEKIEFLITSKSDREFSILMFDIDHFKTVNDTLGHIAGDKCIKKLALIATNCIRDIDHLGRFGGDEFVIILPGVSGSQARVVAERFRKKVDETESPHFTVSIGISAYPKDGANLKELIAVADDGLYVSKQKGRNAVSHKGIF